MMNKRGLAVVLLYGVCVFGAGGIIFGYAALKSMLLHQGVYAELCSNGTEADQPCPEQLLRLDLMYTLSASATNGWALPTGFLVDRIGPKKTSMIGSFLLLAGCLLFAFSSPALDMFIPGYLLMALAGPCIFLPGLKLGGLLPNHAGHVMSFMTGCFGASSIMFFLLQLLGNLNSVFTYKVLFLAYCAVPCFIFLVSFFMVPDGEAKQQTKSAWESLKSLNFLTVSIFMSLNMLKLNFFIGTVKSFLTWLGPADKAVWMTALFSILLPAGGAGFVPIVGYLVQRLSLYALFALISALGLCFSGLLLVPYIDAQFVSMAIFVFLRPILYTGVSVFCSTTFGFENLGRTYGSVVFVSGVFNLTQYGLSFISEDLMNGSYLIANIILAAAAAISFFFPIFLFARRKSQDYCSIAKEAEGKDSFEMRDQGSDPQEEIIED